jgi:hypothetical protein
MLIRRSRESIGLRRRFAAIAENAKRAIFLHSGFRTGSTWFWSRFREAANTCAFYEPFNDGLADLRPDTLPTAVENGASLKHPALKRPYFDEYRALLRPTGGVAFYDSGMALTNYFETGPNPSQQRYVAHLTQHAWDNGKIPVLGFCRSLGRVPWFRQYFSAINIVTLRKPWNRWVSYRQQTLQTDNPYFELCTYLIALVGQGDRRYRRFFEELPLPPLSADPNASSEQALREHFDGLDAEQRLRIFLRVFVLEMMIALRHADHVVDLERMTVDAEYRSETTEMLRTATGLADLSFDDCALPDHSASADASFQAHLEEARTRLFDYVAESAPPAPLDQTLTGSLP